MCICDYYNMLSPHLMMNAIKWNVEWPKLTFNIYSIVLGQTLQVDV